MCFLYDNMQILIQYHAVTSCIPTKLKLEEQEQYVFNYISGSKYIGTVWTGLKFSCSLCASHGWLIRHDIMYFLAQRTEHFK